MKWLARLILLCTAVGYAHADISPLLHVGQGGGGSATPDPNCTTTVGASGIYTGFDLSFCQGFTVGESLSVIGPGAQNGQYFTSRGYGYTSGPSVDFRGLTGDEVYWPDALNTGYQDANQGVPVGYNTLRTNGSMATLQARVGTAGEQALNPPSTDNLGAYLSADGAIKWYVGTNAPIIVEARIRLPATASFIGGWQPTFWLQSAQPVAFNNNDEWDMVEGAGVGPVVLKANQNVWTARVDASANIGTWNNTLFDGNFHTISIVLDNSGSNTGPTKIYYDGTLEFTQNKDANTMGLLQSFILYSLIDTDAAFNFSQAAWNSSGTTLTSGNAIDVQWMKVWRANTLTHYAPLASISDLSLAYNGTGSIVLPSKTSLWNDGTVSEYVQCHPDEAMEPGTTLTTSYQQFPSYVTYNSGTRTVSVDFSAGTGAAGVLHCMVDAYQTTGSTDQPARFNIYRGPNLVVTTPQTATLNQPFTLALYSDCDVGIVTPKRFSITSGTLPTGLSLSGSTISGTPTGSGSTFTVACTNSDNQVATQSVTINVVSYIGPGDVVAGTHYWGLRGYNAAFSGNVAQICDSATGLVCANATWSGTTLTLPTIGGLACNNSTNICDIATVYDQIGSLNLTQATNASRPTLVTSCVNSVPCMNFPTGPSLTNATGIAQSQPFTYSAVSISTNTANDNDGVIFVSDSAGNYIGFYFSDGAGSAGGPNLNILAGGSGVKIPVTFNAWHALGGVFNGASSAVVVDGTATTGLSPGTSPMANAIEAGNDTFGDPLVGDIFEIEIIASALTTGAGSQSALLAHNQCSYIGTGC